MRSNVERTILQVTKRGNKNWENWFISKEIYENWQNCEYSAKYEMNEQF